MSKTTNSRSETFFSDELTQGIGDLRDERISPRGGGGSGEEAQ